MPSATLLLCSVVTFPTLNPADCSLLEAVAWSSPITPGTVVVGTPWLTTIVMVSPSLPWPVGFWEMTLPRATSVLYS